MSLDSLSINDTEPYDLTPVPIGDISILVLLSQKLLYILANAFSRIPTATQWTLHYRCTATAPTVTNEQCKACLEIVNCH